MSLSNKLAFSQCNFVKDELLVLIKKSFEFDSNDTVYLKIPDKYELSEKNNLRFCHINDSHTVGFGYESTFFVSEQIKYWYEIKNIKKKGNKIKFEIWKINHPSQSFKKEKIKCEKIRL